VAFVGGSLQAVGGHNLLEPAAVGTAMVTGPHLHNFVEISRRLKEAGALEIGRTAEEVEDLLAALLADAPRRAHMAAEGRLLVERGRGALGRTMAMVAEDLRQVG
jgi:3-deoxy-D-manno-octulosonic-acid transferase